MGGGWSGSQLAATAQSLCAHKLSQRLEGGSPTRPLCPLQPPEVGRQAPAGLLHFIATYGRDEPEPVIAAAQLAAEAPHGMAQGCGEVAGGRGGGTDPGGGSHTRTCIWTKTGAIEVVSMSVGDPPPQMAVRGWRLR